MPATATVTLGSLVEEALNSLYRSAERPRQVVVGADALDDTSDSQFTLSTGTLDITDRVEGPAGELMLVTAKSTDPTPVYTVSRGYQNTTAAAQPTGTVLLKNPSFTRDEVTRWVRRCIDSLMNAELPRIAVTEYTVDSEKQWAELNTDTLEVFRVRQYNDVVDDLEVLSAWQFEEVPDSLAGSGKILRTPKSVDNGDTIIVDEWLPYEFSSSGEDGEIDLPLTAQDLPILWASAYGLARRQVSRSELDKIEEWNQEQAIRAGVNLRAIRDAWGEVYRRVDEAREVHRVPRNRPYRKMR